MSSTSKRGPPKRANRSSGSASVVPLSPPKAAGTRTYMARPGARISHDDAEVIGRFCERLTQKYELVTAECFVEEAKRDKQVRAYLEWNDDVAAAHWRLHQARVLMGSITVVVERHDREVSVRGLQYLDSRGGYLPAAKVFADVDMTREIVEKAKKEAISWYHRYQNLRAVGDLKPFFDAVELSLVNLDQSAAAAE